ncbi:hypothetical protein GY45DRAFT_1264413 [Cubamyces sp. BRFM 1775]|nr:hypothetical protein GY45DRAFT_1264413 [Cubamyces sp. BRFM 1775]
MVEIVDALAQVHEKETAIQTACLEVDKALFSLRQSMQLPANRSEWASTFSVRLTLINKEYRRSVKHDLQAMATRLRQIYGSSTTTMNIRSRAEHAFNVFEKLHAIFAKYIALYEERVRQRVLTPGDRIIFQRAIPRIRRSLREASDHVDTIREKLDRWQIYFDVLVSDTELEAFLQHLQAARVAQRTFEAKTAAVFGRVLDICSKRDSIVLSAANLALTHETTWLARGQKEIRYREFRREMAKYDDLLEQAATVKDTIGRLIDEVESVASLAHTPTVLPGTTGADISVSELRLAYKEYQQAQAACDAIDEVQVAHPRPVCQFLMCCRLPCRSTTSCRRT